MTSNNKPIVSIISASYNHEKHIAKFVNSILNQTFTNFELIIIDDKSTDKNLKVIKSFSDPRIKVIEHLYNQGPSSSINDGIKKSTGQYIAFFATDDEACSTYLEEGVNFLNKNQEYDALCFQLEAIDHDSNPLIDRSFQQTLKFKNIKYHQLIKDMFTRGNMIPAPGEIIRRSVIKSVGLFNPALLQTQDYDFHVRTLLKHQIYVYQKPLIKYRQTDNNIDNHSSVSALRQNIELSFVLNNFLKIDSDLFNKVFGNGSSSVIPYLLGTIALKTSDPVRRSWGYQTILKFIQKKTKLDMLNSLYSIQYKDIISTIQL